jgi:FkbM family methyltransferase
VKRSGALETSAGKRLFTSAYFLYKRFIEDNLQDLLRLHPDLVRGGNALDIGANIGYTARLLARSIDADHKVFAFEPEAFNFGILQRVTADSEFGGKIIARQCAVGAEDGKIDLWLNDRHHADHRILTDRFRARDSGMNGVSVPMVTIDRFLVRNPGPVSFVKIDVQGYELPVCQGMKDTLAMNPEITVVLEYAPSAMCDLGFDPSNLTGFLADLGFHVYLVGSRGKLSPGLPAAIKDTDYVDLLFTRRQIA